MGDVTGLVVHPDTVHAPNLVYARTNVGGAYRLDADSQWWVPLLDAYGPLQSSTYYVESIAVDPNRPDDVYAVVDGPTVYTSVCSVDSGQVLVSHDRGASWASTGPFGAYIFSNDPHGDTTGERLMVDPSQSGLLYFGSHKDGLWKFVNGAWTNTASQGLPSTACTPDCNLTCDTTCSLDCFAGDTFVVFDKSSGTTADGSTKRVYVGVWTQGVFVSDDGGKSFAAIAADPHPVRAAVASDGALYVSFGEPEAPGPGAGGVRVYRQNAGGAWTDTDITPPSGISVNYSGISTDPRHAGTLIVTTNDARLYRSTNGGSSWDSAPISYAETPPWYWITTWYSWGGALVVDPNDPSGETVWRTDGFAVSRTTDFESGVWSAVMQGFEELVAAVVRTPPTPGLEFYAGVADAIGFADSDRTKPPAKNLALLNEDVSMASSFDICLSQPKVAAFVGWDEITSPPMPVTGMTVNGGATFSPFSDESPGYGGAVAINSRDPKNLVWEPSNGQPLVYSKDGGGSWSLASFVPASSAPGASFFRLDPWCNGQTVAADPKTGGTFYYLSESQSSNPSIHFWVSTDDGNTFQDMGAPFLQAPLYISNPGPMIKPNPTARGDIWVTFGQSQTQVGPLYRSTDSGQSFNTVAGVDAAYQVAFGMGQSSASPAMFFFGRVTGAEHDTMYQSEDLGANWTPISDPTVEQFGEISYLEGDMRTRDLVYVALYGRGVLYGLR
jgi:hypothetical protein